MAKPVIGMIATPQNFVVNTDFTLTVTITGIDTSAGDTVKVLGLLERFAYAYAGTTLTITGRPTRLLSNALLKIVTTNDDGPTNKDVIYNVVPGAPVIAQRTAPKLYSGAPYSFFVPITNRPPKPTVEGLWTGLKYERHENNQGDKGVLISGIVAPGDFTVDSGEFTVNAPYAGGPVSRTFQHDIGKATLYAWRGTGNPHTIHEFRINGDGEEISSVRSFNCSTRSTRGIDVDANYIYFRVSIGNNFYRVSRNTGDGQTVAGTRVAGAQSGNWGVAVDGDLLYSPATITGIGIIYVPRISTASFEKLFRIPSTIGSPRFLVIDGNNLIVYSFTNRALYWIDKDTANNTDATITKTVRLASRTYNDMTLLGDRILLVNYTSQQIEMIDKNTGNNQTAEVLETYLIPSDFQSMEGIAVYTE